MNEALLIADLDKVHGVLYDYTAQRGADMLLDIIEALQQKSRYHEQMEESNEEKDDKISRWDGDDD